MAIRRLFFAHHLFILTHFISAQSEITIKNEKTVYALPGDDVTLTCSILKGKGIHITQTQWSKVVDGPSRRLAVYNPRYGIKYPEMAYNYSVSFRDGPHNCLGDFNQPSNHSDSTANYKECKQWILQLRSVSLEQSGLYECSFTAFPTGTSSSEINLVVKKSDDKSSVVEALLNQKLEIPCFKGVPLVNAALKWLVQKENGNEEILISKQPYYLHGYRINPTKDSKRIWMNSDNMLIISPVSIVDDGKKFVCSVVYHSGRIQKSTTEVKVFVKPEISVAFLASFQGEANFTCVIRKAFAKPNLLWFVDGKILKDNYEGIFIANEDTEFAGGFYEMRSLLTIQSTTQPSTPQALKCMTVYPFPGNETRNISSEEIVLSDAGYPTTSLIFSEFISQVATVSDFPTEKLKESTTPKTSIHVTHLYESTTTPHRNLSTKREAELSTLTSRDNSPTTKGWFNTTGPGNLSTKREAELTTWTSRDNSPTRKGWFNTTGPGTAMNPKHMHFPWPAIVAALLLFCTILIILGVRKWRHYQKEIMNRPPSFKPPPPPIKYTSMQGSDRIYPSCSELENL
ncbi:T-cell surface protein tactile [Elgaria multicarinata webbii]|uniref:T-cell surface protein tactile n=1 Tax=Elgaria multicarinata webbii TaxID=159646 RepID=UPI002FCCB8FA